MLASPNDAPASCAAAVAAAAAVGYQNAGTIEFLFQDGEFFFLEMNTRLQVEHPVTELVTGIDIVQWQIRVASGEALPWCQDDVRFDGHALECRITSEDPFASFMPSTGRITMLRPPTGPGVRWDGGVLEGGEVSLYYDPVIAKLIVHAPTRVAAIDRMRRALSEVGIAGVESSVPFHLRVMAEPDFRAGNIDIRYIDRHPHLLDPETDATLLQAVAAAAALVEHEERARRGVSRIAPASGGPRAGGWRGR